jgi:hypothetical protein
VAYLGLVELETLLALEVSVAVLTGTVLTAVDAMNCVVLPVLEVHVVDLTVLVILGATDLVADQLLLGVEGLVALGAWELLLSVGVLVIAGDDGLATLLRLDNDASELVFRIVGVVAVVVVIAAGMASLARSEVYEVTPEGKHTPLFQQLRDHVNEFSGGDSVRIELRVVRGWWR